MAGTPQEEVQLLTVPFDWHVSETTNDELALLTVPYGKGMKIELLSVGFTCRVLVTAGTVDLEWRDALRDEQNPTSPLSTTMASFLPTNVLPDRVLDCDDSTLAETADILGTLIADLKTGKPLPAYTVTNLTRALTYNCNAGAQLGMADTLGQLILDIQTGAIKKVTFSNKTVDRAFDADSTSILELADVIASLHDDLTPTADLATSKSLILSSLEGYDSIYEGSLIMEQGDTLNLEITVSDSTTDGEGYAAIVEFRVLNRS